MLIAFVHFPGSSTGPRMIIVVLSIVQFISFESQVERLGIKPHDERCSRVFNDLSILQTSFNVPQSSSISGLCVCVACSCSAEIPL